MAKLKYASNGKRDIHGLEIEYDNCIDKLESKEKWKYPGNKEIVIEYIKSCKRGEVISNKKYKKVGKSTLFRLIGILRLVSESWLKKSFDELKQGDIDKFYRNMDDDKLLNAYGTKYKPATKSKIYKTIKKFLQWKYPGRFLFNWDTSEPSSTKEFLTRDEVEMLINGCSSLRAKTLIMMLFDGGFRIEELGNIRWVDLTKSQDKNYFKAHIRLETSKTKKERWVSLLLSTDFITSYKNYQKSKNEKFSESDFLFTGNYQTMYNLVRDTGKRVLNKNISPHTLRHSSATYYAGVIKTYQQFCSRYGWNLSSGTPQRYFHDVDDDKVANQIESHEISKYKTEMEKMRLENLQLNKRLERIEKLFLKKIV